MARRGSTAPLGSPVVPDVYMTSAAASSSTVAQPVGLPRLGTGTHSNSSSGQSGAPITSSARESRRMWSRSTGPASAAMGTTATPARSPATTATTVSRLASPRTATVAAPLIRSANASARPARSAHDVAAPSTTTASWASLPSPSSAGNNDISPSSHPAPRRRTSHRAPRR